MKTIKITSSFKWVGQIPEGIDDHRKGTFISSVDFFELDGVAMASNTMLNGTTKESLDEEADMVSRYSAGTNPYWRPDADHAAAEKRVAKMFKPKQPSIWPE